MEAVQPVRIPVEDPARSREEMIRQGLDELLAGSESLAKDGASRLPDARGSLARLEDQSTGLATMVSGLGPDFCQGDWSPLVESVHSVTTQSGGHVHAFLRQARCSDTSASLLESVLRASAALEHLREEATLLAGRGEWSL